MESNDKWKAAGIILLVVVIAGWSFNKSRKAQLGSTGNNGVVSDMPMPSGDMMKSMEKIRASGAVQPPKDFSDPIEQQRMRTQVEDQLPDKEKAQFRKFSDTMRNRMERTNSALSPEDQQALRQKFMGRMMQARRQQQNPPAEAK